MSKESSIIILYLLKYPYQISKVVNTHLILHEVHVSNTLLKYVSITLTCPGKL